MIDGRSHREEPSSGCIRSGNQHCQGAWPWIYREGQDQQGRPPCAHGGWTSARSHSSPALSNLQALAEGDTNAAATAIANAAAAGQGSAIAAGLALASSSSDSRAIAEVCCMLGFSFCNRCVISFIQEGASQQI